MVIDFSNIKILNILPRFTKGKVHSGGVLVLAENWIDFLGENKIPIQVVDSNKDNYSCTIIAVCSIIIQTLKKIGGVDAIMIHGLKKHYQWLVPILVLIATAFKKKIILRKFGGEFIDYYEKQSGLKKYLLNYIFKNSNLLLWETKYLTQYFSNTFPKVKSCWFTNTRTKKSYVRNNLKEYNKRFVFVSSVSKVKGIDYLLEAFKKLDSSYTLDIYGPLVDYSAEELLGNNFQYKGVIPAEHVNRVLVDYDVLVLPTFWTCEGYPGIIAEAFNSGLPVIATKMGGIPEMIQDNSNGFLIESKSEIALKEAILKISKDNYPSMSGLALKSFENYDSNVVNNRILAHICDELVSNK